MEFTDWQLIKLALMGVGALIYGIWLGLNGR